MARFPLSPLLCAIFALTGASVSAGAGGPETGQSTASLENTLWRLVALGETPVQAAPDLRESRFVLVTETHRVQGDTGCNNRLMGHYALEGRSLKIGSLSTTRKACPETKAPVERAFLKALESTATWQITGENLTLFDTGGAVLARFESLYLR